MNFSDTLQKNPIFNTIAHEASLLGVRAYVIGGFVRDLVMNRPSNDIDVVCIGSGIALANAVGNSLGTNVAVFPNFEPPCCALASRSGRSSLSERAGIVPERFAQTDC